MDSTSTQVQGAARSPRRVRRRIALAAVLVVAAAVVAVVLLADGHGKDAAPTTGVPSGDTTATVTRRTLTESATLDGTLGYGSSIELYDRLAGTFTWLPSVGATITRGGTLFRVNNLPVVLMYGSLPAYRTLKQGVSDGPDVTELNRNLIDLGYDPYGEIGDDEAFGEATAAAVRRWQKAEGLTETGEVQLGRVIFAPGARRITEVHVTLGQDPPGASESPTEKPAKKKPAKHKAKQPADGGTDPDESANKGENEPAGAAEVVLTTTSTQQLVQMKVKAEQQQLARVGERAPVTLPSGRVVRGRIIEVGSVASSPSAAEGEKGAGGDGESESATIPVTLALTRAVAHLDEAPVSVELVKSVRRNVLTVPATALTATAGGGYAIQVLTSAADGQGSRRAALAVTPGMFADGYVQVEGAGLREGLTVIESE